jgi:YD repeat-containing protein
MAYAYDALNRLSEAADLNTGTTSYTYDDVGNLRS